MPTDPIPITTTPPNASRPALGQLPSQNLTTPSSSMSVSPQTPFSPPAGTFPSTSTPTPSTSQGFFKWAAFIAKSPPLSDHQRGFDIPTIADDSQDLEEHDSFEFGDLSHLKARSWNGRRTMSMSGVTVQSPVAGTSGIASMLKGFGESPQSPPPGAPAGGVMADKQAKGQGVLRRLSMGGASYRPNFLSPQQQTAPLSTSPPVASASISNAMPAPTPVMQTEQAGPPQADVSVQRAATLGNRRRRSSENGARRRGVSPMGERILREQGHF